MVVKPIVIRQRKFRPKISSWTSPEGRFLSPYIDKCHRVINNIDFTKKRKFSNLFWEEKAASSSLQKRDDIIMKPADNGGAVVVWLRQLYLGEARRQLSEERLYEKLGSEPINDGQQQVKSTIAEMIDNNELPRATTISYESVITTPRTYYLLSLTQDSQGW